jgi:hypothetical protein
VFCRGGDGTSIDDGGGMLKSIAVVFLTLFTASVAAADTDAPPASPSSQPSIAITI